MIASSHAQKDLRTENLFAKCVVCGSPRFVADGLAHKNTSVEGSLPLMQAARSSASTSGAYVKTQLDHDASLGSVSFISIAHIKLQLVSDASRWE